MTDSYELLDGRQISGLEREDVICALLTFRTHEPRMLRPGFEEALDAMARALSAARANRERREAEDRAHERRRIEAAAQARALLETHCRVKGRAVSRPAPGAYCYTCQRPTPPGLTSALCGRCGGYLSQERAS